ncbi:hypothetical protein BVAVS116_O0022 (plasmid) [Borreliella valaisiana VS116]|uniref:Uncharacterized protein n=1 Tax=Borreliella valaisiana VS116 TaxID=445987 RepID=C0R8D3_BORVA|nr:hypothetical protein BVAVS116_O0022 [Borreliella valaisiana VS116]
MHLPELDNLQRIKIQWDLSEILYKESLVKAHFFLQKFLLKS